MLNTVGTQIAVEDDECSIFTSFYLPPLGSTINIWGRHYLITGADRHVYNYASQHEDKISPQLLSSLLNFFGGEAKEKSSEAKEAAKGETDKWRSLPQ